MSTSSSSDPVKTPPRHSYADSQSPIASIKRPRSSIERSASKQQPASTTTPALSRKTENGSVSKAMVTTPGTTTSSDASMHVTPRRSEGSAANSAMSPMHPPNPPKSMVHHHQHNDGTEHNSEEEEDDTSWVGRKVDQLFSPVLSFLSQQEEESANVSRQHQDDNLTEAPTASESSSSPSHGNEEEEDEVSCGSLQPMEEDHAADDDEFNPWQYIKTLPPYALVSHLCPQVTLPPKDPSAPPVTLVLDLDETLVHCTVEHVDGPDLTFPVEFHGTTYQVNVRLRPYLQTFLKKIQGNYEVVVFTASQKVYANELLNLIDPEGNFIQHRLFRESCMAVEGNFLKDLNVLGRDLSKTVIVDNSPHAFGFQVDNGIPIESWFDDPSDRELLKLAKFLEKLQKCNDVRPIVRERFQCHARIAQATAPPVV